MRRIQLSPSDFTYTWSKDKWAFYEKYGLQIRRPRQAMPGVIEVMDGVMKGSFDGQVLSDLDPSLPKVKVVHSDSWVQSTPIIVDDLEIVIRGKIDAALDCLDGTFGVVDYKASAKSDYMMKGYVRQLQAYAWALENNDKRDLHLSPITRLGVLKYGPTKFKLMGSKAKCALVGDISWIDLEHDPVDFERFLREEIIPFIQGECPEPSEDNEWWNYINCYHAVEEEE